MEENQNTSESKSGMNPMLLGGIILAVLVIGGGIYFASQNTSPTTSTEVSTDTRLTDSESMMAEGTAGEETDADMVETDAEVVSVEAGSFYYKPDVITVKKGQKVRIELKSVDMMHDFNIDELDVQIPITKSGDTNFVEFTVTKVGEFEYYCSVSNHKLQGQVGTLIVE